ncbi:MAG: hypothetical protein AAF098_15825 [Pseudomonadota bacterium]
MNSATAALLLILTSPFVFELTNVVSSLDEPSSIVIQGNDLYIAERRRVIKVDLSDTNEAPSVIFAEVSNGAYLLLDENDLYIALFADQAVMKIDTTQTNAIPETVVTGVFGANGLAIRDNVLYIAESTEAGALGAASARSRLGQARGRAPLQAERAL